MNIAYVGGDLLFSHNKESGLYFIVMKWLPQLQAIYLHSSQAEGAKSPAVSVSFYQE